MKKNINNNIEENIEDDTEFITRDEILKNHKHKVWYGASGYWCTYVNIEDGTRKLVRAKTEDELYDRLCSDYILEIIRNDFSQYKELSYGYLPEAEYLISCNGNIYSVSLKRWIPQEIKKVENGEYRIPIVTLKNKEGEDVTYNVCDLVMNAWVGEPPVGMEQPTIDHKDGDSTNNHYRNLRWIPRWRNSAIRKIRGIGETNNRNRLSMKDVVHICNLLVKKQKTADEIAKMYNVHPSTIRKIREKKSWIYISELFEFYD